MQAIIKLLALIISLIIILIFGQDNNKINGGIHGGGGGAAWEKIYPPGVYTDEEKAEMNIVVPYERKLLPDARRIKYRRRTNTLKLQLHEGQRKLLLSEIEFLTEHGNKSNTVVYAGAAPGYHINYLTKLFPNHNFHLYDPRKFGISKTNKIKLFQQYFTDKDAQVYAKKDVLFISDIRENLTPDDNDWEPIVLRNMDAQQKWVEIMEPSMAMLKFRLSWDKETQEYLDGDIYIQAWEGSTSTETRLYTDGKSKKIYDTKKYEEQLFRFNVITRMQWYPHDITPKEVPGIDHCYDCYTEIHILSEYIKKFNHNKTVVEMMHEINKLLKKGIDVAPHGLCPDIKNIIEREKCAYEKLPSNAKA